MASKSSPKKSLLDYFKVANGGKAKTTEDDDPDASPTTSQRPRRACASKARQAWCEDEIEILDESSEDDEEEEDVKSSKRKRKTRNSSSSKRKKDTSRGNGSVVNDKDKKKKKAKLDPETEAFLRSGVPDVILKCKAKKSLENNNKVVGEEKEASLPEKRRTLDSATLAFLHSGVPDVVVKVQQSMEKKKEQDESYVGMAFFPKRSHVCEENVLEEDKEAILAISFPKLTESLSNAEDVDVIANLPKDFKLSQDAKLTPIGLCCDDTPIHISSQERRASSKNRDNADSRPWIDKVQATKVNLVVDKNGLETLNRWLKQWKMDIKDDGGTSRKLEKKRRRGNSSESDFIESDEVESDLKRKSVLLTGPSGCGKTTAVYVLAKHLGFEVVEVNFSSSRSGKDVLKRVEEAVLSHRLESSHNCLLLFKDIDLFHPEEDEGFFSAVAQLITTAVRPIVMTSCLPAYCLIDSKLDKKDPLRISFSFPKSGEIAEKILKPILFSDHVNGSQVKSDFVRLERWLDSVARHSGCDIRQCINQLQFLLSKSIQYSSNTTRLTNEDIHLYSSPFQPFLVDLNFPRQALLLPSDGSQGSSEGIDDEDVSLSASARKRRELKDLVKLSEELELFGDLDWVSRLSSACPGRNVNAFGDVEETTLNWNHSGMRTCFFTRLSMRKPLKGWNNADLESMIRGLVLESDAEVDNGIQVDSITEEIAQYSDYSIGNNNWENCAAVRSIVKRNLLDSTTRAQKRNGRVTSYFNRMDRNLVSKISNTFEFKKLLDEVKEACLYD